MAEPRHRTKSQFLCDIIGCKEPAERSLSAKMIQRAGLSISDHADRRAHLCKKHYKEFKKKTRKERELERLGW